MYVDIFSIPLSKISAIVPLINEELLAQFVQQLPQHVTGHNGYWLINTNLTVNAAIQVPQIQAFNVLLQYARGKAAHLQLTTGRG